MSGLKLISAGYLSLSGAFSPDDKAQCRYYVIQREGSRLVGFVGELPDYGMNNSNEPAKHASYRSNCKRGFGVGVTKYVLRNFTNKATENVDDTPKRIVEMPNPSIPTAITGVRPIRSRNGKG